jgi:heme a synthase
MNRLRRIAWGALILAYVQSVFGAIVRISGSGMGCGEHWPDCNGAAVPTVTSYTVAVEVTHRYLAGLLVLATVLLASAAVARRRSPGVGGRGGVLRAALFALALVPIAAIFGALVVKLRLSNPYLIAVHYSIAMITLAALVVAVQRAGGLGATLVTSSEPADRTYRSARAAAELAFVTVVLGALTANVPGAAHACAGFPWCRDGVLLQGAPLHIQLTHRVLALLLLLHLAATTIIVTRRHQNRAIVRAAQSALGVVALQIVVAATLIELHLPPVLQSLHQAVGALLWVAVFTYAALARRGSVRHIQPVAAAVLPQGAVA